MAARGDLKAILIELAISHPWNLSTGEAKALQAQLVEKVTATTTFNPACVQTIAGVDVGLRGDVARAAAVVLRLPDLEPVDCAVAEVPITFPYVPGLLAFREGPGVLSALEKLTVWPDLFIFDAHGWAHPRRIGLACHMGVILDRPSIGCAKSRLIGSYDEPGNSFGDWAPLQDMGETIGAAVRSRPGVKPIFVSVGHRVDLTTAIDLVLRCTQGFRLPQTTRFAHKIASGAQREL